MQSLLLYLHYNSISAHHQHHCHTWLGKLYHRPHSLVVLINNLEFLHSIFTQCYLLGNLCHLCCSSTCTVLLYTFRNFIFCISYTTHHIQHSVTSDPPWDQTNTTWPHSILFVHFWNIWISKWCSPSAIVVFLLCLCFWVWTGYYLCMYSIGCLCTSAFGGKLSH